MKESVSSRSVSSRNTCSNLLIIFEVIKNDAIKMYGYTFVFLSFLQRETTFVASHFLHWMM